MFVTFLVIFRLSFLWMGTMERLQCLYVIILTKIINFDCVDKLHHLAAMNIFLEIEVRQDY